MASDVAFVDNAPSSASISERTRTCFFGEDWDGNNGTLSVIIAFLFLLVVFIFCTIVCRGTRIEDEREDLRQGLLTPEHQGGFLEQIEVNFVDPFVPASLEHFALGIFFLWFIFTIPVGITRYYRKIWAVEMTGQHAIFNYISFMVFNCKGKDLTAVVYTDTIPEHSPFISNQQRGSPAEIDYYIMTHVTAAMAWLFLGFIQIYMARDGWSSNHTMQVRVHRAFGYIAISGLICHVIYSTKISRRDPANQIMLIDYNYLGMCVEVTFLCGYGILYAIATSREQDEGRKHNFKRMHRFRMITCWFQGIFGSGAIRITFWFLWIVGHLLPQAWRARIDRGACQSASRPERGQQLGSAESCWVPVALNLSLTNLLTTWLIWILFHLSEFTESDRASFIARLKQSILAVVFTIAAVPILYYWPGLELPIKIVLWPLSLISRMQCLWDLYVTFENHVLVRATRLTRFYHGRLFGNPEEQNEHAD